MQKWEYKLVSGWWLAENKLLEEINNLGAAEWEVCGFATFGLFISWTLKRPLREDKK